MDFNQEFTIVCRTIYWDLKYRGCKRTLHAPLIGGPRRAKIVLAIRETGDKYHRSLDTLLEMDGERYPVVRVSSGLSGSVYSFHVMMNVSGGMVECCLYTDTVIPGEVAPSKEYLDKLAQGHFQRGF